MRPFGFHPGQVLAERVDRLQPACPVECGVPEALYLAPEPLANTRDAQRAPEAPALQTLRRDEATQDCCVVRVGRWSIDCAVHGFVRVDEMSYPLTCPLGGEGVSRHGQ